MVRRTVIMMLLGAACAGRQPRASPSPASEQPIDFALPALGGGEIGAGDLRGRVVLLDFWATWCVPCQESLPFYQGLTDRYGVRGLRVVAVSVDSDAAEVKRFVNDRGLTFDVLLDPEGSLASRLDLPTMPTLFLLGREGTVLWKHAGFDRRDKAMIEEHIHAALEE